MYIENEKLRKRIDEIEEKLKKENNCKTYKQVLEQLNNNELLQLYLEKFSISKDFTFNRDECISELDAVHYKEFDESF